MSEFNTRKPDPPVMSPHGHMTPDSTSAWQSAWFRTTVRRLGYALREVKPDRVGIALSTRATVVMIVAVLLSGCGGSASPTAPSAPIAVSAPVEPSVPPLSANLVALGGVQVLDCINRLCSYRGEVRNIGGGCAVNVAGETVILSAQGVEVARSVWTTLPGTVIRPGENVNFFGNDLPEIVLSHLDGRSQSRFTFDSRGC